MTGSREFQAWQSAKTRCYCPRYHNFRHYGGRGIAMTEIWRNDFARFYAHVGPCPPGHSLDRIDNARGYEPGNVRWATPQQQHRNTRTNRIGTVDGQTLTLVEWAERRGMKMTTLDERLRRGWTWVDAVTIPVQAYRRKRQHIV